MARRPSQSQLSPSQKLIKAVLHPTEEHVNEALADAELASPLDGLTATDFKALSQIIAPYLVLTNAITDPSLLNVSHMGANSALSDLASKLSPDDLKSISAVLQSGGHQSVCGP